MFSEVRVKTKGFATLITNIGLLSSVHPVMEKKAGALTEGLPALVTYMGLLSSVDPLVLNKA